MPRQHPALGFTALGIITASLVMIVGCASRGTAGQPNAVPAGLRVVKATVRGLENDLLTSGVGIAALANPNAPAPGFVDPANPSSEELRRAAVARKFDTGAGEGVMWGTGFDPVTQRSVVGEGKVTGKEFLGYNDDGSGSKNVAMFVQVPDSFDPSNPCILVVAPISASRLYNDTYLASWGLRRKCAVASSDKGGGNGIHDLTSNKVLLIDGVPFDANAAGRDSSYTSKLNGTARNDYLARYPNRIDAKYYGGRNRMAEQGDDMVMAAKFALYELNELYGPAGSDGSKMVRFTKENTTIILVGRSSGGGGAIKSAEVDTEGFFDGVVVFEPAINPVANPKVRVQRAGITYRSTGVSIGDYLAITSVYMPCAARANTSWPGYAAVANGDNVCASLKHKGLIRGETVQEQALDAARKLVEFAFDPAGQWLFPTNAAADPLPPLHAIANTYLQTGIDRVLCGMTVALTVDAAGKAAQPSPAQLGLMWLTSGTYAPQLIYEDSVGGPVTFQRGVSPSTGRADYSLDAKLCLQAIKTGTSAEALKYRAGEAVAANTGDLHGKPTLIMHGREDARVPVTPSSRMYLGLNSVVEGSRSNVHYIEVPNVAHVGGTPSRLVPQAYFLYHGLDWMWNHLKNGKALPPHQVLRTSPRGIKADGSVADLTYDMVPGPSMNPRPEDRISVDDGSVVVPD